MPQLHCSDGGIETLRTEMPQEAVLMVLRFLFRKCFVSFIVDSGTEKVILLFLGFKQRWTLLMSPVRWSALAERCVTARKPSILWSWWGVSGSRTSRHHVSRVLCTEMRIGRELQLCVVYIQSTGEAFSLKKSHYNITCWLTGILSWIPQGGGANLLEQVSLWTSDVLTEFIQEGKE